MECPSKIISIHCVIAATPYLNTGDKEQSLADSLKKSWTIVSLSTLDVRANYFGEILVVSAS